VRQSPDPLALFVAPLNRLRARYAVTGAMAMIAYGEPRLTNDIDFIVSWPAARSEDLYAAFAGDGRYVPDPETLALELSREHDGHFNIVHAEFALRADVYCAGTDTLNAWALNEAKIIRVDALPVRVAPPEYVIVRKLLYTAQGGSAKHLQDIRAVLRRSGELLDLGRVEREAELAGVSDICRMAQKNTE